jgi:hypothetical protein
MKRDPSMPVVLPVEHDARSTPRETERLPLDFSARLERIVGLADDATAAEVHVGAVVVRDAWLRTEHASSPIAQRLDAAQFDLLDGLVVRPDTNETVTIMRMPAERRWPAYAALAEGLGIQSLVSFRMGVSPRVRLHLNFYSERHAALGPEVRQTGWLLAEWARTELTRKQRLELHHVGRPCCGTSSAALRAAR